MREDAGPDIQRVPLDWAGIRDCLGTGDADRLAALALKHLDSRFRVESDEREYTGAFVASTLEADDAGQGMAFWRYLLNRCDGDDQATGYLFRSFRHFCSKQESAVNREYAAIYAQIVRLLHAKSGTRFQVATLGTARDGIVKAYGLSSWPPYEPTGGLFAGDWRAIQDQMTGHGVNPLHHGREGNGRYATEDLAAACELLLASCGQYCRPYILSRGINLCWAKCTRLNLSEFLEYDPERHAGADDGMYDGYRPSRGSDAQMGHIPGAGVVTGGGEDPTPSGMFDWDVAGIVRTFVDETFDDRELRVLAERCLPGCFGEDDERTLAALAGDMGISHQTVANIGNCAMDKIRAWLGQYDAADRRMITRVLPDLVEKRYARCL